MHEVVSHTAYITIIENIKTNPLPISRYLKGKENELSLSLHANAWKEEIKFKEYWLKFKIQIILILQCSENKPLAGSIEVNIGEWKNIFKFDRENILNGY